MEIEIRPAVLVTEEMAFFSEDIGLKREYDLAVEADYLLYIIYFSYKGYGGSQLMMVTRQFLEDAAITVEEHARSSIESFIYHNPPG